jgi:hypothetical protein
LVKSLRSSVVMTVVAIPLATSPALYPPIPSASTTSPLAASEAIESSLCDRTMPGSVQLAISRVCVRSMRRARARCPRLCPSAAAGGSGGRGSARRGAASRRDAQRLRELFARLVPIVGILRHRLVQELHEPGSDGGFTARMSAAARSRS